MITFSLIERLWKRLQHYSGRENPWIKLHHDLVSELDFRALPDKAKYHLVAIMMQSARNRNVIQNEPKAIRSLIGATTTVDLQRLVDAHYLVVNEASTPARGDANASTALAEDSSDMLDALRVRVDKEEDKETPIPPSCDSSESARPPPTSWIMDLWNNRTSLPIHQCSKWTAKRQKAATARLKDHPERSAWEDAIDKIAASAFCNGAGDRGWTATIDFLLRPDTITKALEAQYDDGRSVLPSSIPAAPAPDPIETEPLTTKEKNQVIKAIAALKVEIGPESFNLWIKPTEAVRLKGGNIVFFVPSDLARNWLASHYKDTIETAMREAGFDGWEGDFVTRETCE